MTLKYFRKLLIILIYITIVAGCITQEPVKNTKYNEQSSSVKQANKIISEISPAGSTLEKNESLLNAAGKYIDANLMRKAANVLKTLDYNELSKQQLARLHLLQAQIFINSHDSIKALDEINEISGLERDPTTQNVTDKAINEQYQILGMNAVEKLNINSNIDELNFRIGVDDNLSHNHELANQNKKNIWQKLISQDSNTIKRLITEKNYQEDEAQYILDNKLLGWLELAEITKNTINNSDDKLILQIQNWQRKFYNHPAKEYFSELQKNIESPLTNGNKTNKIAVLLPLTGNLGPAAKAIKDGMLAAYYLETNDNKPEIVFIDTKNNPDKIIEHYKEALSINADIVIGPLNKTSVNTLNNYYDNKIPIVALNYIPDNLLQVSHDDFYQFGISAEDEARQGATRAWQNSQSNSLIIVEDNDWGYRVSQAYKEKLESLGGNIAEIAFVSDETDLKKLIYTTLGVIDSQNRKNTLQWVTNEKLSFQLRRRQDFDHIFLITNPEKAKQIKPLLKFYYADNVPIIATSNILDYKSTKNKMSFKDLDNIQFCDIPMIINNDEVTKKIIAKLNKSWPKNFDNFIRLYALGVDSYKLSNNLKILKTIPNIGIASNSGHLIITDNNKIHRQLPWAKINDNGIQMLDVL